MPILLIHYLIICSDFVEGPDDQVICDQSLIFNDDSSKGKNSDAKSSNYESSDNESSYDESSDDGSSCTDTLMNIPYHNSDDDRLFENLFLGHKYNIRKDVHEKLKRWAFFVMIYLDLGTIHAVDAIDTLRWIVK